MMRITEEKVWMVELEMGDLFSFLPMEDWADGWYESVHLVMNDTLATPRIEVYRLRIEVEVRV